MAQVKIPEGLLERIAESSSALAELPAYPTWIDHDREADVVYLSFERLQHATDSLTLEDGILLRYREDKLVGITILEASKRKGKSGKSPSPEASHPQGSPILSFTCTLANLDTCTFYLKIYLKITNLLTSLLVNELSQPLTVMM